MKRIFGYVILLTLVYSVISCSSDDSLPEKFAEAFQNGDSLECVKLYPNSKSFLNFIDAKKLQNLGGQEKHNYLQTSSNTSFIINGVYWQINNTNHTIEGSDGLVNVERVMKKVTSNQFYETNHYFFEEWEKETRDIHKANHINKFLQEFENFWNVLNAIKQRDVAIVRNKIPNISYFINKKFSDDFENASLTKDKISLGNRDSKLLEINYYGGGSFSLRYNVSNKEFFAYGIFDRMEYEKAFSSLPIKVQGGYDDYSDGEKIRIIKNANDYITVAKKYIEAVLSNNTELANKLYPKGSFISSSTIKSNIGKPVSIDHGLIYSDGCMFEFEETSSGETRIKETYRLYNYSSFYSQYLAMNGATRLDLSDTNYDRWNYNLIHDAIRALSNPQTTGGKEDKASQHQQNNINTGGWQKGFIKDEFGNKDESHPYIYQTWPGRRNDSFDCQLGIRITDNFVQFTIIEDYQEPNLSGVTVTGQLNGNKFQIQYSEAENESVYIGNTSEIRKVLSALDTDGTLMLSFRRTDSFGKTHNYLFTIHGSTSVSGAIQKFLK